MSNPYLITGPAVISFSGGRTSGYMLRQILDAYSGDLPSDVVVTFANTGKERPETLDFVRDCGARWNVPIAWLEWRDGEHGSRFEVVSHNSASRAGEPFAALIAKKPMLPNPMLRYCTIELKIRVMRDFARSLGWEHWRNVVGLRADEPGRVGRAIANGKERWTNICPLAEAGVSEADVLAFWKRQAFDLRLKSYQGNCDLCFLKSAGKITTIMRERPDLVGWWAEQEAAKAPVAGKDGDRFRQDRAGYADLAEGVRRQGVLFHDAFDDNQSCEIGCTDQEPEADLRNLRSPAA